MLPNLYYAGSQTIFVPASPPQELIVDVYAQSLTPCPPQVLHLSGMLYCACCHTPISNACIKVRNDCSFDVTTSDSKGYFHLRIPFSKAPYEFIFSHPYYQSCKLCYNVLSNEPICIDLLPL